MSEASLIACIESILNDGYDPLGAIVENEMKRFPRAVIARVGHDLLPEEDWQEAIITIDGRIARIVLIHARRQGEGAFTRLLSSLKENGLSPAVIEPTAELQDILRRRGWRFSRHGKTFETRENRMSPPKDDSLRG